MNNVPGNLARTPLLVLAGFLSVGTLIGSFGHGPSRAGLVTGIALLGCTGWLSLWSVVRNRLTAASIFLALAFFACGLVLAWFGNQPAPANRIARIYDDGVVGVGEPVELTGTVSGQPEPAPQSFYLTLSAERIRAKGIEYEAAGTVLLTARLSNDQLSNEYNALELRHGARLRLAVTLSREDSFRNPGVMPFTEYLERQGYDATGVIKSPLLIERLDDERVFLPLALLYEWRERLQQRIHYLFSPETAGVLDAAMLGNHYNISLSAAERFRAGGTFHVLVISGLQIAFIGGLMLLVVRWFTKRRILQVVLAAALLWGYTIAVGADASVVRSAFMFTVVLLAPLVWRPANTLNNLGGAAIFLLVWRPNDLLDPSFQLTFLSVLSIVALAVPLISQMRQVGSWRPTHETPYPPAVSVWFRAFSESLFWSERGWKAEMAGSNIRYRLFKTRWAGPLERWRVQGLLRFAANAMVISAACRWHAAVDDHLFHPDLVCGAAAQHFVGGLMSMLSLFAMAAVLVSTVSGGHHRRETIYREDRLDDSLVDPSSHKVSIRSAATLPWLMALLRPVLLALLSVGPAAGRQTVASAASGVADSSRGECVGLRSPVFC
jgi:competence protein ComEC